MKLMLAGSSASQCSRRLFMTGTFTAINLIDNTAIAAEQQRAVLALETVLGDEAATPDAATASGSRSSTSSRELVSRARSAHARRSLVAIPGSASVLAWTPRRFASEAFESVAPMRLAFGALIVGLIAFIMLRLHDSHGISRRGACWPRSLPPAMPSPASRTG